MAAFTNPDLRLLGLGNEILADDAFGLLVAREASRRYGIETLESSESGLSLLDSVTGPRRLLVVDTIQTGQAAPGTVFELREGQFQVVPGGSPHRIGLFETLSLARALGMPAPEELVILAVEPADCLTVGGQMCAAVSAAMEPVLARIGELL